MSHALALIVPVLFLLFFLFLPPALPTRADEVPLRVLSVLDDDITAWIDAAFTAKTGIRVEHPLGKMSSVEALGYLEQVTAAPDVSVMVGGSTPIWVRATSLGLLAPYRSPEIASYDPALRDPDGHWAGIYRGTIAIVANRNAPVPPPSGWKDLAREPYRGKLVMASPSTSGTAYTILASLVQLWGEPEAFRYFSDLNRNIPRYPKSGAEAVRQVSEAVAAVGICFDHDAAKEIRKGAPLAILYPEEGTGWEIGGAGIIRNAPEPKAAEAFIDFVLSLDFQQGFAASNVLFFQPTHPGAARQTWSQPLAEPKLIPLDFARAAREETYLTGRWNREVVLAGATGEREEADAWLPIRGTGREGGSLARRWLAPAGRYAVLLAASLLGYLALRRRMTLAQKFVVLVVLCVGFTAFGIATFVLALQADTLFGEFRARTILAARLLAERSANSLLSENVSGLKGEIAKFVLDPDVLSVEVADTAGATILGARAIARPDGKREIEWTARPSVAGPIAPPIAGAGSGSEEKRDVETTSDKRLDLLEVTVPVVDLGKVWGEVRARFSLASLTRAVRASSRTVVGVALAAGVIGLGLSLLFAADILRPLKRLSRIMAEAERGNLEVQANESGRDEIAALGGSFNRMVAGLREMIRQSVEMFTRLARAVAEMAEDSAALSASAEGQSESCDTTLSSMEELRGSIRSVLDGATVLTRNLDDTNQFIEATVRSLAGIGEKLGVVESAVAAASLSATGLAHSSQRISRDMDRMNESTIETASWTTELVSSIRAVAERVREARETIRQADEEIAEGRELIQATLGAMKGMAQVVAQFVGIAQELGEGSQKTRRILRLIGEVSEEAGLLALNASILAAQAGVHGRGFGVIAQEMRGLAGRSEDSAREAERIIHSILGKIEEAVEVARLGSGKVDEASRISDLAAGALDRIEGATGVITGLMGSIGRATDEQDTGSRRMIEAVERGRDLTGSVAKEATDQSRETQRIRAEVERIAGAVGEMAEAAGQHGERFGSVRKAAGAMEEYARVVHRASREQAEVVEYVLRRVDSDSALAGSNRDLAREMRETADDLRQRMEKLEELLARFSVGTASPQA